MPRGKMYDERVQLQVRFTPEIKDRLEKESARRGVSKNYLVERATCEKLPEWEKEKL